jgi:DHA1 family bicyclomycin/chloramphenicol resistance-like MFS transporter
MSQPLVVLILSLLLGLQPLTSDLYLPALPALAAHFGAAPAHAQLTLTALILAFGVSQLFWGPLSDRIGRRRVLLLGVAGYLGAAIGSALATSIDALIAWRLVQGACMGAGTVCSRAIVRDLYAPLDGARVMSKGLSGLGVAACLGPALGGLLGEVFGWRATLVALVVAGAVTLYVVWRYFQETLHAAHPQALHPATLLRTVGEIAVNRRFWLFSLLSTCSLGGLMSFLVSSSFIFIGLHEMSKAVYGLVLFSASLCYIGGTLLCRRALVRCGLPRTLLIGGALSLTAGALCAGLALAGVTSAWALIIPAWIYMLGHGCHQPCGQSGAIAPFPKVAGTASALTGFIMTCVAFAAGRWMGAHAVGSSLPLVQAMSFWSLAVAGVALLCSRQAASQAAPR